MKTFHSVSVPASLPQAAARWEVMLRYGAAYLCTLIAVIAAQLIIRNEIALVLGAITLIGWPLSLWLRRNRLVVGGIRLQRPIVNACVMICSLIVSTWIIVATAPGLFSGNLPRYFELAGAGQIVSLLMQAFLTFAACRCLAIINDKDAVLCTVPSFSVLLLLVVVHRGPEVVPYFLAWAMVSAVLFALDHRREMRRGVSAQVPPVVPGQEMRLSARGLGSVMGFSMLAAIALSYGISRDNPDDPNRLGWVQALAGRLTQLALDLPDVSVNAGPERQIDFTSGPSLPTRAPLWAVTQTRVSDEQPIRPQYWRMFTFALYDGRGWSQAPGGSTTVPREILPRERWPRPLRYGTGFSRRGRGLEDFDRQNRRDDTQRPIGNSSFGSRRGYDVERRGPKSGHPSQFGAPRALVEMKVIPLVTNTGFLPTLPGVIAVRLRQSNPESVHVPDDGSVDMNFLRYQQSADVLSQVPTQSEYGLIGANPPNQRAAQPNPDAQLSADQRRLYTKLPATLPARVVSWAKRIVASAPESESDYARAQRLSAAVRDGAAYTLRPPAVPENRDATEYFLFGSRRGYCTYFAGALAVTCRAVGIPARVVSGFTNPEWQTVNGQPNSAVLRESGAHAWTEVWVPNWGWAMLDATPPDDRGDNAPSFGQNWQDLWGQVSEASTQWLSRNRLFSALSFLALAVMGIAWWIYRHRDDLRARGLRRGTVSRADDALARRAITNFYRRATRRGARGFRPRAPWETPFEWQSQIEAALQLRDPSALRRLTDLYAQACYSPRPLGAEEVQAARDAAKNLSWERNIAR